MKALSVIVALALAASATARTFTVYNGCPFTIWYVCSVWCTVLNTVLIVVQARRSSTHSVDAMFAVLTTTI